MLGDRYRTGRAHFDLGGLTSGQIRVYAEHLSRASNIFRELGARRNLERAEAARAEWDRLLGSRNVNATAIQLITLRLAEAASSCALLLRELAAVLHQETDARRVMILEPDEERNKESSSRRVMKRRRQQPRHGIRVS